MCRSKLEIPSIIRPRHPSPPRTTIMASEGVMIKSVQKMNKSELQAAIRSWGEIPAASWNMAELRHRLRELMDLDEEEQFSGVKKLSPLQQQIVTLNKQKRRKADLVRYLEDVLRLPVNHNETMYQMEVKAMDYLYKNVESTGRDVVGFGRHAAMTYTDLLQTYPQYTEWVVKTYEEAEDSCPRLQRLAKWLTRATDVTSPVVVAPAAKGLKLKLKGGGYATEPEHEMPQRNKYGSSSSTTKAESEQMAMMKKMMATMKEMKDEIDEIRETNATQAERPRKKEKEMK